MIEKTLQGETCPICFEKEAGVPSHLGHPEDCPWVGKWGVTPLRLRNPYPPQTQALTSPTHFPSPSPRSISQAGGHSLDGGLWWAPQSLLWAAAVLAEPAADGLMARCAPLHHFCWFSLPTRNMH